MRSNDQRGIELSKDRKPWRIVSVRHRVCTAPLRPLPLLHDPNYDDSPLEDDILLNVRRILADNGYRQWELAGPPHCRIYYCDGSENLDTAEEPISPTLVITASAEGNTKRGFEKSVRAIKTWVDGYLDQHVPVSVNMGVEWHAEELARSRDLRCLHSEAVFPISWEEMKTHIEGILQNVDATKDRWDCIALLGIRSFFDDPVEDRFIDHSEVSVVLIAFDRSCSQVVWEGARVSIEPYFGRIGCDTELASHMQHSDRSFSRSDTPEDFDLSQCDLSQPIIYKEGPVLIGCDIGAGEKSLSTLCCFVELHLKETSKWQRFALTNYNGLRNSLIDLPAKNGIPRLQWADRNGIKPGDVTVPIDSPSRLRHNILLKTAEERQLDLGNLGTVLRRRRVRFFEDSKQELGSLWAASGLARRSARGSLLDWALVEVKPERLGTNTIAMQKTGSKTFRPKVLKLCRRRQFDPDEVHALCFRGAVTGRQDILTSKHVARVRQGTAVTNETLAIIFDEKPRPFHRGDSGAVVYNCAWEAVGMFSATGINLGYVTPLHDILDDIRELLCEHVDGVRFLRRDGTAAQERRGQATYFYDTDGPSRPL
ncbi:hypothetical protein PWT90_02716 [Aphanocladium album]|nr:hypothetical protein PWT90_02716 [Aphanocladium album]